MTRGPGPRAEFVFVPAGREYFVPWLLGLVLVPVLSALGAPAFVEPRVPSDATRCLAVGVLGVLTLVMDGALLWAALRPQFLTWASGRRPYVGTFAALVTFYVVAWGTAFLIRGAVRLGLPRTREEVCLTMTVLTVAAAGLMPALALSAIWKLEEPGFANVRLSRQTAIRLLDALIASRLSAAEYPDLLEALRSVSKDGVAALGRAPRERDRMILDAWRSAANRFLDAVDGLAFVDLEQLGRLDAARSTRETLERTY